MKMCNACGETKPYSEFNKNSETHDGYRYTCKVCRRNKVPTNPEFSRVTRKRQDTSTRAAYGSRPPERRLAKYGLTVESFQALMESQNELCACCGKDISIQFCIDHCHATGAVRGLLCYSCNSGIGLLGDNLEGLSRAIAYLSH